MIFDNCGEVMTVSSSQMGCVFLILLSILVLNHEVLGARLGKVEHVHKLKPPVWRKSFTSETDRSYYTTSKRAVPSSPDRLHNR